MCAAAPAASRCGSKLEDGTSKVRKVKVPELGGLHGKVARWPQAFRPAGYDWGRPMSCPSY